MSERVHFTCACCGKSNCTRVFPRRDAALCFLAEPWCWACEHSIIWPLRDELARIRWAKRHDKPVPARSPGLIVIEAAIAARAKTGAPIHG